MAEIRVKGEPRDPLHHDAGLILYLNRCEGGETFTPGFNDSRTNRSSIINSTRTLPAYPYGDASWNQVVQCVSEMMAPYNIIVTDEDPGNVPHDEAVACGHPNDLGMQDGVGGVAPFSCGVINNAITYTFPEVWGNWPRGICETIAQEAAHGWGLDHEYLCADPMTYLTGCGDKSYQDIDAQCGEFSARSCQCGGSTQNSHREILSIWGASDPTPPSVTITDPLNNAAVQPGFVVRATVQDAQGVKSASLYVDGNLVQTLNVPPYTFNAPGNLGDGSHEVEVVALDNFDAEGSDQIFVIVGEPCTGDSQCGAGEACVDGRCVPGPGSPGGLGEDCDSGADCSSGLCGETSDGTKICTEQCELGADGCPSGFACQEAGGGMGVCWPGGGDGGGCCAVAGERGRPMPWTAFGLMALVAVFFLRRKR